MVDKKCGVAGQRASCFGKQYGKTWVGVATALVLSGCAVTPQPMSQQANEQRADDLLARVTASQEPVIAPIDLYSAMARAIKYNLDYRVEVMEQALRTYREPLRWARLMARAMAQNYSWEEQAGRYVGLYNSLV